MAVPTGGIRTDDSASAASAGRLTKSQDWSLTQVRHCPSLPQCFAARQCELRHDWVHFERSLPFVAACDYFAALGALIPPWERHASNAFLFRLAIRPGRPG